MQWDASAYAGFSTREPWLPLTPDHKTRNVAVMRCDESSILNLVRRLLHLRRKHAALHRGAWRLLSCDSDVLAYERIYESERMFIAVNFSQETQSWSPPIVTTARIALSTHGDRCGEIVASTISLRADEGVVIELC
jgi:alpha-glucosidase